MIEEMRGASAPRQPGFEVPIELVPFFLGPRVQAAMPYDPCEKPNLPSLLFYLLKYF